MIGRITYDLGRRERRIVEILHQISVELTTAELSRLREKYVNDSH